MSMWDERRPSETRGRSSYDRMIDFSDSFLLWLVARLHILSYVVTMLSIELLLFTDIWFSVFLYSSNSLISAIEAFGSFNILFSDVKTSLLSIRSSSHHYSLLPPSFESLSTTRWSSIRMYTLLLPGLFSSSVLLSSSYLPSTLFLSYISTIIYDNSIHVH